MNNLERLRQLVDELPERDREIHEKAKYNDILKEIFLKSPQAMAILGEDWKYLLVNNQCAIIHGFECPDQLEGKCITEIFKIFSKNKIKEIKKVLDKEGVWEGPVQNSIFLKEEFYSINLQKIKENNFLVCMCNGKE